MLLGSRTVPSVHCEGLGRGIARESVGPKLSQEYKKIPAQAQLSLMKISSTRDVKNLISEERGSPWNTLSPYNRSLLTEVIFYQRTSREERGTSSQRTL